MEAHPGDLVKSQLPRWFKLMEVHPGCHLVPAIGKSFEHLPRLLQIGRFAQRLVIEPDQGIGTDDNRLRITFGDFARLGRGVGQHQSG